MDSHARSAVATVFNAQRRMTVAGKVQMVVKEVTILNPWEIGTVEVAQDCL